MYIWYIFVYDKTYFSNKHSRIVILPSALPLLEKPEKKMLFPAFLPLLVSFFFLSTSLAQDPDSSVPPLDSQTGGGSATLNLPEASSLAASAASSVAASAVSSILAKSPGLTATSSTSGTLATGGKFSSR